MKYMMLIHQGSAPTPQTDSWNDLPEEDKAKVYAGYKDLNETPGVTPGFGLQPPETATTVRVENGAAITTDGPFVELKEAIGGYFVLDADDLDSAIEVAMKVPAASMGGAVEVRPIQEW